MGQKNAATEQFQNESKNAVENAEMVTDIGLMTKSRARQALEEGGRKEAARLGVDPTDAQAIITEALASFDAHVTQGGEEGGDDLSALLNAI